MVTALLIVGGVIATAILLVFVASLCMVAKRADEEVERMLEDD